MQPGDTALLISVQSATTAPDTGATEVDHLSFSSDGKLMFFTQGRALHVYRFLPEPSSATPEVSHWTSIVFRNGISDTHICPTMNRVIIVNDSSMVYFWDVNGVEGVQIPAGKRGCLTSGLTTSASLPPGSRGVGPRRAFGGSLRSKVLLRRI